MKATIESTAEIIELEAPNGGRMPARVWKGKTDSGVEFTAYVTRVQVLATDDYRQFERELQETRVARKELKWVDFRLVL
jgi:hypothetical protein